eukprot:gene14725-16888_t
MSSEKAYRVEEGPRGQFAVAVRDIQAGEMVSEEEPLLFFRNSVDDKKAMEFICFESGTSIIGMDKFSPAFSNFMREVSPENQSKILCLYGPTVGTTADDKESCLPGVAESVKNQFETFSGMGGPPELLYMLATVLAHKIARHHAAVLPLLKLEFRIRYLLLQAALRAYISAFEYLFPRGHNELQRDLVFVAVLCCDGINPSVMSIQDEKLLIQRALRNHLLVKGRNNRYDELDNATARVLKQLPPVIIGTSKGIHVVVAAFSAFMKQLTPEKQRKYLTLYGPTTGLPAETIRNVAKNDFQYRFNREEGHRNLTPDEVETFVKVAQITRLNIFGSDADDVVSQRFDALLREHFLSDLNALLEDLLSIPTPRRHAASLPLLQLEWRIKHCLFLRGSFPAKTVHDALSKYFACLENLFPHPHKEVSEALTTAAALCCDAHFPSVFPPQQQKELCQKAVRMHLLIHGRRMRHALLDDTTAGVLENSMHTLSIQHIN